MTAKIYIDAKLLGSFSPTYVENDFDYIGSGRLNVFTSDSTSLCHEAPPIHLLQAPVQPVSALRYHDTFGMRFWEDIVWEPVDKCALAEPWCENSGSCSNGTLLTPVCTCPSAFTGERCERDADECALEIDNCDTFARCDNTLGGFTCTCNAGFEGNGTVCADIQAPEITPCPADVDKALGKGQGTLNVFFQAPTSTDNSGESSVACSAASGQPFAVGTTLVTCTASDAAGNEDACSFTVTVRDEEPPAWTCADAAAVTDADAATATVVLAVPAVGDNVLVASRSCDLSGPQTLSVGATVVTCVAVDSSGNEANCTYSLVVTDAQAPDLTCSTAPVTPAANASSAEVSYSASADDNVDGSVAVSCNRTTPEVLPVGEYGVRCEASDAAGNVGACELVVQVRDEVAPVVTCPAPVTVATDADEAYATADIARLVVATDNLGLVESVTCDVVEFALGTQQTTCTVR